MINCSKCGKSVDDLFVTGSAWQKYANPGEQFQCDECMRDRIPKPRRDPQDGK